jgi:Ca-activated chloride channel family protein
MKWDRSLDWLILAPIVAMLAFVYGHQMRRRLLERAGKAPLVRQLLATFSLEKRLFKQLLLVLAVAATAVAAMRPQYGARPEAVRQAGIDVAVAFDISKSMLARDVQPSRLEAARDLLKQLLDGLIGHRMALVPFAGIAFTQSPLTADKSAIRLYLESLDPRAMPVGGTNMAMAIEEGLRLLTSREDRGDRASRSQVILLVTDGEDVADAQGEAAKAAARKAAEKGVRLYAVAVGTRLGEPIPLLNEDGTHAGYQRDSAGKPIYSKLNLTLLEELVRLASPEDPDRQRVFLLEGGGITADLAAEFDRLQKTTLESSVRHKAGEKYQYVLVFAVLLLLFDLFVSERRRRRQEDAT